MIKEQKRFYGTRDNHEKEYYLMLEAKDLCEQINSETNNMDQFVEIAMSKRLTDEQRKFVLHVASCGTFLGKMRS